MRIVNITTSLPFEAEIKPPTTARARCRMERRLVRIEKRLELAQGERMNMQWLSWQAHWADVWNALGRPVA
jgi:hypothetical protein